MEERRRKGVLGPSDYISSSNRNRNSNSNSNSNSNGNIKDKCLSMHQPWASLLVHGIKRIEGRSWPSPLTCRLWIHAASKVPDLATVKTMEEFYREIYARDGITDLEFPQQYPVSRLIGCIEVVGCLRRQELACWKEVPEGVRLEALTDFCWLCENPQKLSVPLKMRGWCGVYDLDSQINEVAMGSLVQAKSPFSLKFPLPNPQDPLSLRPGSLSPCLLEPEVEKSAKLAAIINAASQAATQFSNKGQNSNAYQAATKFSNKGQSSKSNSFDSKIKNVMIPEDIQFVRNNQYAENNRLDNGKQRYSTRPAVAQYATKEQNRGSDGFQRYSNRPAVAQYVRKEQNMGSNGFCGMNQRDLHTSTAMQFVRNDQIDGIDSLDNNLRYSTRPAVAQYVKKEQNMGSSGVQRYSNRPAAAQCAKKEQNMESNGFRGMNQRDLYTSTTMQFVQNDQIDGITSLDNNLRKMSNRESNELQRPRIYSSGLSKKMMNHHIHSQRRGLLVSTDH